MRGIVSTMEKHHRTQILDEALEAAVKLSHRYIPDRQLPDKAVSLLDTSCARVAVSHHATPAQVEDCQRRLEALQTELEIIAREAALGFDTIERQRTAKKQVQAEPARLETLQAAWKREKSLVDEILSLRAQLRESTGKVDAAALPRLKELQSELANAQGDRPLVLPSVDEQAVASVVADWTG